MSTIYDKLQISVTNQENPKNYMGDSMLEASLANHTELLNELSGELGLWEEEEAKIRAEKMKVASRFAAIERLINSTTAALACMRGEDPPTSVVSSPPARKYFKEDGETVVRVVRPRSNSSDNNRQIRLQNMLNAFDSVQQGGIARQSSIVKAYFDAGHAKDMPTANNHIFKMIAEVLDPAQAPPGFLRAVFWKTKESVCV